MRSDAGFRRVGLGEVAAAVGYAPLVPAWTPGGYELAEVGGDVSRAELVRVAESLRGSP